MEELQQIDYLHKELTQVSLKERKQILGENAKTTTNLKTVYCTTLSALAGFPQCQVKKPTGESV